MDVLTTQPLPLAEWLSVVEREYLSGFVPAGGASVKLAILDDAAFGPATDRLIALGQQCAMLTAHVDAGRTRVHMMHELFFAIARAMLAALCIFVRKAGAAGLMVVLDVRQLSRTSAVEGVLRYSPAAVMDAYEVLREIIDDAEHLPGLFVAVLADAALATGDPRRALSQYAALQMRVWPDVRPGDRQNPVAPLVWLGP